MPRNEPKNRISVTQMPYDQFAVMHQTEISEVLDLLGFAPARFSGHTTLAQLRTPPPRPPLPIEMQAMKRTSFFRLLTAAGRENCPDGLNVLLYLWLRRMGVKIPDGVFVQPRGRPGRHRKTFSYYDTWIRIGRPPLHQRKLALAMFGEDFKRADKAGREKMVDRCRKAIIRHQAWSGQNPSA